METTFAPEAPKQQPVPKKALAEVKRYVLLQHMHPTAPFYMELGEGVRIKMDKLKKWSPYLQTTIVDEDGNQKTIRYKIGATSIYLEDQIKAGIPANAKFTIAEREAVAFHYGVNDVQIRILQEFFDHHPQFEGFRKGEEWRTPESHIRPCFELYDAENVESSEYDEFERRLTAANAIKNIDSVAKAHELLIHVFGSYEQRPTDLKACKNMLVRAVDRSDEDIQKIISWSKNEVSEEDKYHLFVGKLIAAGLLSFDSIADEVCKRKDDEWIPVRSISSVEYSLEERQQFFVSFLMGDAGKPVLEDLRLMMQAYNDKLQQQPPAGNKGKGSGGNKDKTN